MQGLLANGHRLSTLLVLFLMSSCVPCATAGQPLRLVSMTDLCSYAEPLLRVDEWTAELRRLEFRIERAQRSIESPPVSGKGEFETSAQYAERIANYKANQKKREEALQSALTKAQAELKNAKATAASRNRTYPAVIMRYPLVMGPYDADEKRFAGLAPAAESWYVGKEDSLPRVLGFDSMMPGAHCPVQVAKRLRQASDKGELYGTLLVADATVSCEKCLMQIDKSVVAETLERVLSVVAGWGGNVSTKKTAEVVFIKIMRPTMGIVAQLEDGNGDILWRDPEIDN